MEERRKNEPVHCPVCRALWPCHLTSPSGNFALESMPVSMPVTSELSKSGGGSSNLLISQEKAELLDRLREVSTYYSLVPSRTNL